MTEKKSVTLEEGAEMLVVRILAETDPQKRVEDVIWIFRSVEKKAIREAAIIYKLGGEAALLRLFAHHGIEWNSAADVLEQKKENP